MQTTYLRIPYFRNLFYHQRIQSTYYDQKIGYKVTL